MKKKGPKHEIDLTSRNLAQILTITEKENLEHFCLFGFYIDYGLRRAEAIGGDQKGNHLPGIMIEDIKWNDGAPGSATVRIIFVTMASRSPRSK